MSRPLILITNDDSITAEGIRALHRALEPLGECWVVAPATEQSAVSHAITLWHPLWVKQHGEREFAVTGTPTDCVYMAVNHLLPRQPDICVSGINHGANLGDDVIYSGTVAGAAEACLRDVPAVAVSLASYRGRNFDAAAAIARRVATSVLQRGLPRGVLLNVNVPRDATADAPIRRTKLGRRSYGSNVTPKKDPRGRDYFWIGGGELGFDDIPGSDCNAIARQEVTVSPVRLDMTHYDFLDELRQWDELGGAPSGVDDE